MTIDIAALLAEVRNTTRPPAAPRSYTPLIWRLYAALVSTAAERDRLGEALFEAYEATRADTDGATTWQEFFHPISYQSWGEVVSAEIYIIREDADHDVVMFEAERDAARAERDAAIKEMHARELHHFEEEQKSAALHAIIEEALSVPGGMHVMNRTWRECAEEMRRILFRGTAEKGADDDH